MLLQPHKPALADAIWAMTLESSDVTAPQGELQFFLYVRCVQLCGPESMERQSSPLMDTQAHPQRHNTGKTDRRERRCNCHIY